MKAAVARPKSQGQGTQTPTGASRTATPARTTPCPSATANATAAAEAKNKTRAEAAEAAERQVRREAEEKITEVFRLADADLSGSIEFNEFTRLHRELMKITGHMLEGSCGQLLTTSEEVEKHFREHDRDHNMSLDFEEWKQYMEGLLAVLGARAFVQACAQFLEEERQEKANELGIYDPTSSNRLLERVRVARTLREQAEEIEALLAKKANADFFDSNGSNILFYAVSKAELGLVEKLIEARANPSKHNKDMESAAFVAARARDLPMLQLLLTGSVPEVQAAEKEATAFSIQLIRDMANATGKSVRDLLSKRADPNFRDPGGWTPLAAAVFFGKEECVDSLLRSQGSGKSTLKMDALDARGRSALHIAARKGHHELVQPLVRGNADPDLPDQSGWTPLHHAAFNGEDACVAELVKSAKLAIIDSDGFTPWMLAVSPSQASPVQDSTKRHLEPPECISFSKKVVPILANNSLSTYEKLQAMYKLPGVNSIPSNLRFYEAFFHPRSGPNKVRLTKTWEGIAEELLLRERSGNVDVEPSGSDHDEKARLEVYQDILARREEQSAFLEYWLRTTAGPPPGREWPYENREAFREDLQRTATAEAKHFSEELDGLHRNLLESKDGNALCSVELVNVLRPEVRNQDDAHPILLWLDTLDLGEAFQSLRAIGAKGVAGKTEEESLMAFMELVINDDDFNTGIVFWKNVYKLWLSALAKMANLMFQQLVKKVLDDFNAKYEAEGLTGRHHEAPPKSYEQMRQKERRLNRVCHDTHPGRRVASGFLDVVRCAITVNCPRAAVLLLEDFFRPLRLGTDKIELIRVENGFHKDAKPEYGYRDLVLNLHWTGAPQRCPPQARGGGPSAARAAEMSLAVVGEVRISLEEFVAVRNRMQLITKYLAGGFDHVRADSDMRRAERSGTDMDEPPPM